jgi:hypothetical protein
VTIFNFQQGSAQSWGQQQCAGQGEFENLRAQLVKIRVTASSNKGVKMAPPCHFPVRGDFQFLVILRGVCFQLLEFLF